MSFRRFKISTSKILFKNISGQMLALFLGKIFGAIAGVLLIRYLGAEKQGVYSYILSIVYMFGFITDFGLTALLTREVKISGERGAKILGNSLLVQAGQIAASIIFINIYGILFEMDAAVRYDLMLASVVFTIMYMGNPFLAVLGSYEKMYLSGLVMGTASILNALLIFISIKLGFDISGIILMLGISNIFYIIMAMTVCMKYAIKPVFNIEGALILNMVKMSIPFALIGLFSYVFTKVDIFMLYKLKGAEDAGYYSAVVRVLDIIIAFVMMIMGPVYPRLAYVINKESIEKALRIINITVKYTAVAAAPFVLIIAVFNEKFTEILLGSDFYESKYIFAVLIWGIFIMVFRVIPQYALNSAKYTKILTILFGIIMLISIGLNLWIIPLYSYMGAAFVNLFCNILILGGTLFFTRQKLGAIRFAGFTLKITAALACAGLVMFLMKDIINFILLSLAAAAVYSGVIFILKYFNEEDFGIVKNLFSRKKKVN